MEMYRVTTDELYHHGIKGQKWYVRRYQNEDGTLTEAGKVRYGNAKGLNEDTLSRVEKKAKKIGAVGAYAAGYAGGIAGWTIGGTISNALGATGITGAAVGGTAVGLLTSGLAYKYGKDFIHKRLIAKEFANKNPDTMNTDLGKKYAEDILNNRKNER